MIVSFLPFSLLINHRIGKRFLEKGLVNQQHILSLSNCKQLFLWFLLHWQRIWTEVNISSKLTFLWNLLQKQSVIFFKLSGDSSKSQLWGIIIKFCSIRDTFHRQIHIALQSSEIKLLYYLDEIDFIRNHSSLPWDTESIVAFMLYP